MKKVCQYLNICFTILAFLGAGYILINRGNVNAGYAIIPMLFALIFRYASLKDR